MNKRNTKKTNKKMNKKYPYKTGGKNRTKKITLLLFVMLSMVLLVGTVSAINWDNKEKYNDTSSLTLEKYGKYEIYNSFILGIGYGNKLIDLTLEKNTESCADNCEAIQDIILYEDGSLVDDIRFYSVINGIKTNDLTSIRNYEIFIGINEKTILEDKVDYISCQDIYYKNGTIGACYEKVVSKESVKYYDWVEYELGTEMPVGHYKIKLQGEKKWNKAVDWEIKSQGIWTEKWATWGSALTTAQESHGESMVTYSGGNSLKGGVRIFVTHGSDITLFNMTKPVGEESTKCYVAYLNKTIIATADFVGNDCDIADTTLKTGEFYWLFGDKGGAVYDNKYDGSVSYNISGTYIDWTKGQAASDGNEHDMVWAIESVGVGVLVIGRGAVSLNTPANNDILNSTNVVFNCSANQTGATLINITRQDNSTGTWTDNQTIDVTGTANSTEFTQSLGNGVYLWSCSACDSDGDCGFAPSNYTLLLDTISPTINITSPTSTEDYGAVGENESLNWNVSDNNLDTCWYDYNGTNTTVTCSDNQTNFVLEEGIYNLTFWVNDSVGNTNSSFVEWVYNLFDFNDYTYDEDITESTPTTFSGRFQTGSSLSSSYLEYNNTNYSISINSLGGNRYILSSSLTTPSVNTGTNITWFFWVNNVNATAYNQTVININLDDCSTYTFYLVNYTLVDELSQENIVNANSTIESLVIVKTVSGGEIAQFNKTFTGSATASICSEFNLNTSGLRLWEQSRYGSTDHVFEQHNIQNATMTSLPNEITLRDLISTSATTFRIQYKSATFLPVANAVINIQRKYIGEGIFKEIESPLTDTSGESSASLDLNSVLYRIIVSKNGITLATFENPAIACDNILTGDCSITINERDSATLINNYDTENDFNYGLSQSNRTITLAFSVPSGENRLVNLFVNQSTILGNKTSCNQTLYATSGQLQCDIAEGLGDVSLVVDVSADNILIRKASSTILEDRSQYFGTDNIVLTFFLVLSLVLLMISSPITVLIGLVIGLIASSLMLLLNSGDIFGVAPVLTYLIIIVILLIVKISGRER